MANDKQSLEARIKKIRERYYKVEKIVKKLKKTKKAIDINIDFYIDSNYLRHELNYLHQLFTFHNKFISKENNIKFDYYHPNKDYYYRVFREIFLNFEKKIENQNRYKLDKEKINYIDEFELRGLAEKILDKKEYQDSSKYYLNIKTNIKFFIASEVSTSEIITKLKYLKKNQPYSEFKKALDNNINFILSDKKSKLKESSNSYDTFKSAIDLFCKMNSEDAIIEYGKTNLRIELSEKNKNYFIKYTNISNWKNFIIPQEKGVDTRLTISALDDTYQKKQNSTACIITNDTDFFPLFERINKDRELYWISGDRLKQSSMLKKHIKRDNNIFLKDILFDSHYRRLTTGFLGDKRVGSLVQSDIVFSANFKQEENSLHSSFMKVRNRKIDGFMGFVRGFVVDGIEDLFYEGSVDVNFLLGPFMHSYIEKKDIWSLYDKEKLYDNLPFEAYHWKFKYENEFLYLKLFSIGLAILKNKNIKILNSLCDINTFDELINHTYSDII